jgi:hypothetical protein
MDGELDLGRLGELREMLEAELPEIVATLLAELDAAIGELQRATAAQDLAAAGLAAHAARNSALMIGARPLLEAWGEIETGAREGEPEAVRAGLARPRDCWPALRVELERLQ